MKIRGDNRLSRIALCVEVATQFQLSPEQARDIIDAQIDTLGTRWDPVCCEAGLGEAERCALWGRQFLNKGVLQGY